MLISNEFGSMSPFNICECKVGFYARVWSLLVIFTYLIKPKLSLLIVLKTASAKISIPLGTLRLGLDFLNSLKQFRLWLPHCYIATNYLEHIIITIHHRKGAPGLENFQYCMKWKTLKQWRNHLCFYWEGNYSERRVRCEVVISSWLGKLFLRVELSEWDLRI